MWNSGADYTSISGWYRPKPAGGGGTASFLVSAHVTGTTQNITTTAIDTTGANFIVIVPGAYNPTQGANPVTINDSKTNSWTSLAFYNTGSNIGSSIWYAASPTVGTGHTFTLHGAGYSTLCVAAFSGLSASPFDQQNGLGTTGSSSGPFRPGSITPANNGSLIITGIAASGNTAPFTIDSGFTVAVTEAGNAGASFPSSIAYLVQTTASAVNPGWTSSIGSAQWAVTIASFK